MRFASAVSMLLTTVTVASAQAPTTIAISQDGTRKLASIAAMRTGPYQGGPWAAIPVSPSGANQRTDYRVRAWQEEGKVRVVVFSVTVEVAPVLPPSQTNERETQIATFVLSPGESRTVGAEQYGGIPVTVSATAR